MRIDITAKNIREAIKAECEALRTEGDSYDTAAAYALELYSDAVDDDSLVRFWLSLPE